MATMMKARSNASANSMSIGVMKLVMGKFACPLSIITILIVILSSQSIAQSSAAQKFVPNGRYGRRADLPPMPSHDDAAAVAILDARDILATNYERCLFGVRALTIDDFTPLWCTPVNVDTNQFKCLKRRLSPKNSPTISKQQQQQQQQQQD